MKYHKNNIELADVHTIPSQCRVSSPDITQLDMHAPVRITELQEILNEFSIIYDSTFPHSKYIVRSLMDSGISSTVVQPILQSRSKLDATRST